MRMAAGLQALGRTRLRDSRTSTGDGGMEVGSGLVEMVHVKRIFTLYFSYFRGYMISATLAQQRRHMFGSPAHSQSAWMEEEEMLAHLQLLRFSLQV